MSERLDWGGQEGQGSSRKEQSSPGRKQYMCVCVCTHMHVCIHVHGCMHACWGEAVGAEAEGWEAQDEHPAHPHSGEKSLGHCQENPVKSTKKLSPRHL